MKLALGDKSVFIRKEGTGTPLVLLHGQPGHAQHFEPLISYLKENFLCLALDRPGYGLTELKVTDFKGNAEVIIQILDSFNVDKAVILGHSWGGGVALYLAEHFPERVDLLVLVASIGTKDTLTSVDYFLAKFLVGELVSFLVLLLADRALPEIIKLSQKIMVPKWFNTRLNLRNFSSKLQDIKIASKPLLRAAISSAKEQRYMVKQLGQIESELYKITCPTLILAGEKDNVVPLEGVNSLKSSIKNSTLKIIGGAGHLLIVDSALKVAESICDFVSDINQNVKHQP